MNKKNRKQIISMIKYELEDGSHTFTMCKCGRHGTRCINCWECLLEELENE